MSGAGAFVAADAEGSLTKRLATTVEARIDMIATVRRDARWLGRRVGDADRSDRSEWTGWDAGTHGVSFMTVTMADPADGE